MRTCLVAAALLLLSSATAAQSPGLITEKQKFSYAIGLDIGQSLIRQGVDLDQAAFSLAIQDSLSGTQPRLSPTEMQILTAKKKREMRANLNAIAIKNQQAGKAYLAQVRGKAGVKSLPSGILYKVLKAGSGTSASLTDTVNMQYRGTLIDGREFDNSERRGTPTSVKLSDAIEGWRQVIPLMREGAHWQVFIPPKYAYGASGAGSVIGPNETLVFVIQLLEVL